MFFGSIFRITKSTICFLSSCLDRILLLQRIEVDVVDIDDLKVPGLLLGNSSLLRPHNDAVAFTTPAFGSFRWFICQLFRR